MRKIPSVNIYTHMYKHTRVHACTHAHTLKHTHEPVLPNQRTIA